jgi:hypothetical protein
MGRDITADKTPLLQNAEQNIGNSAVITPQVGAATCIPQTNPERLLQLTGGSASGQTTSIVVTASRLVGAQNPNPGFPGPITGVIEFGNGGRSTRVEFDIPVGPFYGNIVQAAEATEPQDGGVVVTVPTGVLRVYARYDNLLLATVLGTSPPASLAQLSNVAPIGPGGPVYVSDPAGGRDILVPPEPVLVKAMAAYFTKPHSKVYRTLYCYCSDEIAAPTQVTVSSPSVVGGFSDYAFYTLPPFTKRIKILRFDVSVALTVLLHNGVRPVDYIVIPGGTTAPSIDVVGNENIVGISSGNSTVKFLAIVCEIGV